MALNHGFLQQFTQEPSLTTQMGNPSQESFLQGTEAPSNELIFRPVKYTEVDDWDHDHFHELMDLESHLGEWLIEKEGFD